METAEQVAERAARALREIEDAVAALDEAARAAVPAVAPVIRTRHSARKALHRMAHERAIELALRAVAVAEETLAPDSLVAAHARLDAVRMLAQQGVTSDVMMALDAVTRANAAHEATWRDDERLVSMTRRNLAVLAGRWRAGTLGTPTAEERAYFFFCRGTDARRAGARMCVVSACDALKECPRAALDEPAQRDVHGVLCALLEADARGALLDALPRSFTAATDNLEDPCVFAFELCGTLLEGPAAALPALENLCGFTRAQLAALQALRQRLEPMRAWTTLEQNATAIEAGLRDAGATAQAREAAAVARHGLRCCALPACGAREPAPRTFKKCGRCGAVHYCCAEHQAADWRRHKRADACKAPTCAQA
jgi:hypothetical protein